jgi:competence protein ComEC
MTLSLTIWDVQHGSAAYVRTPNGKHVVIDLGTGHAGDWGRPFSPLRYLREQYGVRALDEVIITHPHRDHLDDVSELDAMAPAVLRRPRHLSVSDIRAGNQPGDVPVVDKYLELDARYTAPLSPGQDVGGAENSGGAQIVSFAPFACARSNLNNHSLVTFIRFASTTILVPGDNEAVSWRELLLVPDFRNWLETVDVFVAAHHGREAGYCADVFEHCAPSLVVISDGPAGDTDAAHRYGRHATGWPVWSRSKSRYESRYVLTTRCDGVIQIDLSWTAELQKNMGVTCA